MTVCLLCVFATKGRRYTTAAITGTRTVADTCPSTWGASTGASSGAGDEVRNALHALVAEQSELALAHDTADLRQLMRTALAANNDAELLRVLHVRAPFGWSG